MGRDAKERMYHLYQSSIRGEDKLSLKDLRCWVGYYRAHYSRWLPADRKARILEIGCGYGRFLHFLRSEGYVDVHGIDVSPEQIRYAWQFGFLHTEEASAVDFLKDKADRYDVIVMLDVLEHFEKEEAIRLLDAICASLTKTGRLILQLPNALAPLNIYRYGDFSHETAFTPASITQLLRMTHFHHIQTRPLTPHIHGPKSLLINLMWRVVWQNLIRFYMWSANGNLMGDIYTGNFVAVAEKGAKEN